MPTSTTERPPVRLTSAGNFRTICCNTLKPADADHFFRNLTPTEAEQAQVGADGETILHLLQKCKTCESEYRAELRAARGGDSNADEADPGMSTEEAPEEAPTEA